ncbi:guanylate cyclase [Plakobranchus ocellatus]|uniref:Guanylate cyclase n=1 Tax=Plakobranchus ocellatus TaxID=259542 RepID=A0AAV3YAN0_9GAST|nr:guanylate cyclase [Plakobranchus ocellatus]
MDTADSKIDMLSLLLVVIIFSGQVKTLSVRNLDRPGSDADSDQNSRLQNRKPGISPVPFFLDPNTPKVPAHNPYLELLESSGSRNLGSVFDLDQDKQDRLFALKGSSYLFDSFSDSGEPHSSFSEPVSLRDNSTLTLGYLVVDRQRAFVAFRGWKVVSGALSYAIEKINSERIVPGYNFTYVIRDIRGLTNDSLMEMSRLWRDGVVGFIGPANTCKNEALLAAAWNLPILSHVSYSQICILFQI